MNKTQQSDYAFLKGFINTRDHASFERRGTASSSVAPTQESTPVLKVSTTNLESVTTPTTSKAFPTVRVYQNLNAAVFRKDVVTAYRLWIALRTLDTEGKGWVSRDSWGRYAEVIGWSVGKVRLAKSENNGIFFEFTEDKIFYNSLVKVCVALDTTAGRTVFIPRYAINSYGTFRKFLYLAFFANGVNISRQNLEKLFGIDKRTQRRYEKSLNILKEFNYVEVTAPNWVQTPEQLANFESQIPFPSPNSEVDFISFNPETRTWSYQIVNSYKSPFRSMKTRSDKVIRGLLNVARPNELVFKNGDFKSAKTQGLYHSGRLVSGACGDGNLWKMAI